MHVWIQRPKQKKSLPMSAGPKLAHPSRISATPAPRSQSRAYQSMNHTVKTPQIRNNNIYNNNNNFQNNYHQNNFSFNRPYTVPRTQAASIPRKSPTRTASHSMRSMATSQKSVHHHHHHQNHRGITLNPHMKKALTNVFSSHPQIRNFVVERYLDRFIWPMDPTLTPEDFDNLSESELQKKKELLEYISKLPVQEKLEKLKEMELEELKPLLMMQRLTGGNEADVSMDAPPDIEKFMSNFHMNIDDSTMEPHLKEMSEMIERDFGSKEPEESGENTDPSGTSSTSPPSASASAQPPSEEDKSREHNELFAELKKIDSNLTPMPRGEKKDHLGANENEEKEEQGDDEEDEEEDEDEEDALFTGEGDEMVIAHETETIPDPYEHREVRQARRQVNLTHGRDLNTDPDDLDMIHEVDRTGGFVFQGIGQDELEKSTLWEGSPERKIVEMEPEDHIDEIVKRLSTEKRIPTKSPESRLPLTHEEFEPDEQEEEEFISHEFGKDPEEEIEVPPLESQVSADPDHMGLLEHQSQAFGISSQMSYTRVSHFLDQRAKKHLISLHEEAASLQDLDGFKKHNLTNRWEETFGLTDYERFIFRNNMHLEKTLNELVSSVRTKLARPETLEAKPVTERFPEFLDKIQPVIRFYSHIMAQRLCQDALVEEHAGPDTFEKLQMINENMPLGSLLFPDVQNPNSTVHRMYKQARTKLSQEMQDLSEVFFYGAHKLNKMKLNTMDIFDYLMNHYKKFAGQMFPWLAQDPFIAEAQSGELMDNERARRQRETTIKMFVEKVYPFETKYAETEEASLKKKKMFDIEAKMNRRYREFHLLVKEYTSQENQKLYQQEIHDLDGLMRSSWLATQFSEIGHEAELLIPDPKIREAFLNTIAEPPQEFLPHPEEIQSFKSLNAQRVQEEIRKRFKEINTLNKDLADERKRFMELENEFIRNRMRAIDDFEVVRRIVRLQAYQRKWPEGKEKVDYAKNAHPLNKEQVEKCLEGLELYANQQRMVLETSKHQKNLEMNRRDEPYEADESNVPLTLEKGSTMSMEFSNLVDYEYNDSERLNEAYSQGVYQQPRQVGIDYRDPAGLDNFDLMVARRPFPDKPRKCRFCVPDMAAKPVFDAMNVPLSLQFITGTGRIIGRQYTGLCRLHQRQVARMIKTARHMGLISHKKSLFHIENPFPQTQEESHDWYESLTKVPSRTEEQERQLEKTPYEEDDDIEDNEMHDDVAKPPEVILREQLERTPNLPDLDTQFRAEEAFIQSGTMLASGEMDNVDFFTLKHKFDQFKEIISDPAVHGYLDHHYTHEELEKKGWLRILENSDKLLDPKFYDLVLPELPRVAGLSAKLLSFPGSTLQLRTTDFLVEKPPLVDEALDRIWEENSQVRKEVSEILKHYGDKAEPWNLDKAELAFLQNEKEFMNFAGRTTQLINKVFELPEYRNRFAQSVTEMRERTKIPNDERTKMSSEQLEEHYENKHQKELAHWYSNPDLAKREITRETKKAIEYLKEHNIDIADWGITPEDINSLPPLPKNLRLDEIEYILENNNSIDGEATRVQFQALKMQFYQTLNEEARHKMLFFHLMDENAPISVIGDHLHGVKMTVALMNKKGENTVNWERVFQKAQTQNPELFNNLVTRFGEEKLKSADWTDDEREEFLLIKRQSELGVNLNVVDPWFTANINKTAHEKN